MIQIRHDGGDPDGGQFAEDRRAEPDVHLARVTIQDELDAIGAQFGADVQQVRRDHLISHVLAAIAQHVSSDDVAFFGGTALSRTYLTNARLSEDVDLIALRPRAEVAAEIETALSRGLARSYGRPSWTPALTRTTGSEPAVLTTVDGTRLQIQLLSGDGYQWPTEVVDLAQRYSDAPPARMRTLTAPAFAASKLSAWIDRGAPRDLYDLWALAEDDLITPDALDVFVRFGQFGRPPSDWVFDRVPTGLDWRHALSHQTILEVEPEDAAAAVRAAWRDAGRPAPGAAVL